MKVAILDDYFDTLRWLPCFAKLDGFDVTVFTDHVQDVSALAARLAEFDALVLFRERTAISGELLEKLPKLRLISMRGAYPHVDVAACTRNGVLFCSNTKAAAPSYPAAELTWALILASMRQVPQQMASLRAGDWQMGVGRSLSGRTLGVYGYGRLGRKVAQYGAAFDMEVRVWGSEAGRARALAGGVQPAESREAFFSGSDIVSLHVRLTPETRGLITADDLALMGPRALFVNTSRAGLVAPGALLAALNRGRPGYAALDVFEREPVTDSGDPLVSHPNVIATPHVGFVTEDEFEIQFADAFDQVVAFAEGAPVNVINPEVLA